MTTEKKALTAEQIDGLFAFCKKHYVQYYDVQVELVDHLANAVENEMKKDEGLSFEAALEKIYTGFGYAGFAPIVASRVDSMSHYNSQLRKKLFFSYFTWPKATLLACLFLLLSLFQRFFSGDEVIYLLGPFLIGMVIYENIVNKRIRKQVKRQKLQLLLTATGIDAPFFSLYIIFNLFYAAVRYIKDPVWFFVAYESMALVTVLSLAALLAYRDHTVKLMEHAEREYPVAFVS